MKLILINKSCLALSAMKDKTARNEKLSALASLGFEPMQLEIQANAENDMATITIDKPIAFDWDAWFNDEDPEKYTAVGIGKQLKAITANKILVEINSPGGNVADGLTIYDLLKEHKATVTTHVRGMTASAATVIAQAGDVRKISKSALYLIHNSWTYEMGSKERFAKTIETLSTIDTLMASIYAERSGKTKEEMIELMNSNEGEGKWLSADEAKEFNLVDEIAEPEKKAQATQEKTIKADVTNTASADKLRALRLQILEKQYETQ
jgi:ATP-dependent protease ClpP protease subunit